MGSETECRARFGRLVSAGKALLETEALIFRGDFRLSIPFKDLSAVDAEDGELRLTFPEGTAIFELGPLADKWAAKIRNPKSLLDKLGVKPDSYLALVGLKDEAFLRQIRERTRNIARGRPKRELDIVFVAADGKEKLKQLDHLQSFLKPEGAIWVVWPKGRPEIKEGDVIAAAKEAGLVDIKVVKFSESHSALKLVIPLARRSAR
jgi:hypothetical protein